MNKEEFVDCLKHPEYVVQLSVQDLESVLNKYPYFQTARILKQKAMQEQHAPNCDAELYTTIQFIGSRDALYDYISSPQKEISATEEIENLLPEVTVVAYASELAKDEPSDLDLIIFSDSFVDDTKPVTNQEDIEKKVEPIPDPLGLNYQNTWSLNEDLIIAPILEAAPLEDKGSTVKPFIRQDLLDEFIKKDPKITPMSDKHSIPLQRETKPKAEHTFATEALAKIYLKQGKYEQAISTFEALSLKYPEKSIYFATQLNKVKQLLANHKE